LDMGENLCYISRIFKVPVLLKEEVTENYKLAALMKRPFLCIEKRSNSSEYGKVVYDMYTVSYNLNQRGCNEIETYIENFCNLNEEAIIKRAKNYEKMYEIKEGHGELPYMKLKLCKIVSQVIKNIITDKNNLHIAIEDIFLY